MAMRTTSKQQEEVRDARRAEAKKTVEEGMKSLLEEIKAGKTERLVEWMQYCAAFHRYSTANQWLIAEQCHRRGVRASHVASYKAWQEMGHQVRKGEKALYVWAPRPYTKTVTNKKTQEDEEKSYTGFVLVPVFDAHQIAQGTDPETGEIYKPLQHFFTPLPTTEESEHLYQTARMTASEQGFTCSEQELSGGLQGYNQGKAIVINARLDSTSKFCTFVHELTHGLLHQQGNLSKREVECEAEACSYIISNHFGFRNPFSSDYLLMYGIDENVLMAQLERIRRTAHEIIEKVEAMMERRKIAA